MASNPSITTHIPALTTVALANSNSADASPSTSSDNPQTSPSCEHTRGFAREPLDFDAAFETIAKASAILHKLDQNLDDYGAFEPLTSVDGQLALGRMDAVSAQNMQLKAHEYIFERDRFQGGLGVDALVRHHLREWTRKWGDDDGVFHQLLQLYPENASDIMADHGRHEKFMEITSELVQFLFRLMKKALALEKPPR